MFSKQILKLVSVFCLTLFLSVFSTGCDDGSGDGGSTDDDALISVRLNDNQIDNQGAVDLGLVAVNKMSKKYTFTIENSGSDLVTIESISLKDGSSFVLEKNDESVELDVDGEIKFSIVLYPKELGIQTDELTINIAGNISSSFIINVSGEGTDDADAVESTEFEVTYEGETIVNNQVVDLGYSSQNLQMDTKLFTISNNTEAAVIVHALLLETENGPFVLDKSNLREAILSGESVDFTIDFKTAVSGDKMNKITLLTSDVDNPEININLLVHVNVPVSNKNVYLKNGLFIAPHTYDQIYATVTIIGAGGHGGNGADVGYMNGHRGAGGGGGGAGQKIVISNLKMVPNTAYDVGVRTVRVVGSGNSVSYISEGDSQLSYDGKIIQRAKNGSDGKDATNKIEMGAGGKGYVRGSDGSDGRWVKYNEGSGKNGSITGASGGKGGSNGTSYGIGGTGGKGGTSRTATTKYYLGERGKAGKSGAVIIEWTGHYTRKVK